MRLAVRLQNCFDKFGELTGRKYKLMEYYGHPEAECVVVMMGASCGMVEHTLERLNAEAGGKYKVGVIKVRLFRPFPVEAFMEALPPTVKLIAAMDKTKESGATGALFLLYWLRCTAPICGSIMGYPAYAWSQCFSPGINANAASVLLSQSRC